MNGIRQRFLTKFLQVRLEELKRTLEERLDKLDVESIEVEVREMVPFCKRLLPNRSLQRKIVSSYAENELLFGRCHGSGVRHRRLSIKVLLSLTWIRQVKERYNTRIMRQTERELIPLGKGTVEKVKTLRTARLRKKVSDKLAT